MNCIKCNSELAEGAKFCKSCGQNQEAVEQNVNNISVESSSNCIKCNNELAQGAKFCKSCGQNQTEPVQMQQTQQMPQNQMQQTQMPQNQMPSVSTPSFKESIANMNKKTLVGIGTCVLGVVLIGGIAASTIFSSPASVVEKAFSKTYTTMVSEREEILSNLPIYEFFKDFATGAEYSLVAELEDFEGVDIGYELLMNVKNGQSIQTIDVMGYEFVIKGSNDYVTFETDILRNSYGIDYSTLAEDLKDFDLVSIDLPDSFSADELTAMASLEIEGINEVQKILTKNMSIITKGMEVTESGSGTTKVGGKSVSTTTYAIDLPQDILEDYLSSCLEDIFKNDTIIEYLDSAYEFYSAYADFAYEMYYETIDVSDFKPSKLQRNLEYVIDEFIEVYDEYVDDIEVTICNGRIYEILVEIDKEDVLLTLNADGNIFEEISLEVDGEEVFLRETFEKGVYEIEFGTKYETIGFEYDTESSRNNMILKADGEELKWTVDTTKDNEMRIAMEIPYGWYDVLDLECTITKNSLSKNWFSQDSDFKNLLSLDEDDFEDIAYEIIMSMMY